MIRWAIMIPFILALTFFIILTLVFVIPGLFLFARWFSIVTTNDSHFNIGDMKVPTFYSPATVTEIEGDQIAYFLCMPVVGVVFGGIHCVGWFFSFPSNDEAILWRVSSAVLTGIAFLLPLFLTFVAFFFSNSSYHQRQYICAVFSIILQVYIVSRLLLLVEAFISLRHLTPGMLALVKWTSFIPHI
jgi:hypothetical protein